MRAPPYPRPHPFVARARWGKQLRTAFDAALNSRLRRRFSAHAQLPQLHASNEREVSEICTLLSLWRAYPSAKPPPCRRSAASMRVRTTHALRDRDVVVLVIPLLLGRPNTGFRMAPAPHPTQNLACRAIQTAKWEIEKTPMAQKTKARCLSRLHRAEYCRLAGHWSCLDGKHGLPDRDGQIDSF
jgi:hypothetical protein